MTLYIYSNNVSGHLRKSTSQKDVGQVDGNKEKTYILMIQLVNEKQQGTNRKQQREKAKEQNLS